MKVDFHTHTNHSYDCYMSPKKLLRTAEKRGLDAIAITDHDSMKAFEELENNNYYNSPVKVIKGCEFKTSCGDIIGIFINEQIKYKSPEDLIRKIEEKGGVAIIPHPFKHNTMSERFLKENVKIIETLNGRTKKELNKRATLFAKKNDLIGISCSDSHTRLELGNIYNEFDCETIEEVKRKLLKNDFKTKGKENNLIIVNAAKILGAYKKNGIFGLSRKIMRLIK